MVPRRKNKSKANEFENPGAARRLRSKLKPG
jgi:hypothetical protein